MSQEVRPGLAVQAAPLSLPVRLALVVPAHPMFLPALPALALPAPRLARLCHPCLPALAAREVLPLRLCPEGLPVPRVLAAQEARAGRPDTAAGTCAHSLRWVLSSSHNFCRLYFHLTSFYFPFSFIG